MCRHFVPGTKINRRTKELPTEKRQSVEHLLSYLFISIFLFTSMKIFRFAVRTQFFQRYRPCVSINMNVDRHQKETFCRYDVLSKSLPKTKIHVCLMNVFSKGSSCENNLFLNSICCMLWVQLHNGLDVFRIYFAHSFFVLVPLEIQKLSSRLCKVLQSRRLLISNLILTQYLIDHRD